MQPNHYFSTLNVPPDVKTCKRPGGKRYQRTNSYDELYFATKHLASIYGRPPYQSYLHNPTAAQIIPTVYSSGLLYGHPQLDNIFDNGQGLLSSHANKANGDDGLLYRNSPLANYSANSYMGWHKGLDYLTTMPRPNRYNPKPTTRQQQQNANFDCLNSDHSSNGNFFRGNKNNTNSDGKDCLPSTVTNNEQLTRGDPHSPFGGSMDSERSPPLRFRNNTRRNRIKWCIICSIFIIIVAVLIAFGVAVYSQAKSQQTGLKLVRQYRGYFLVVGGRVLDFDGDLLNTETSAFKNKAKLFESKIDAIFEGSGLTGIYEGSQITAFQFVVAIPALEVHFNVRTKVNVQLQVTELLTIFEDAIRKNSAGVFGDVAIDLSSLTIENQTLNYRKRPNSATQKSLTQVHPS